MRHGHYHLRDGSGALRAENSMRSVETIIASTTATCAHQTILLTTVTIEALVHCKAQHACTQTQPRQERLDSNMQRAACIPGARASW